MNSSRSKSSPTLLYKRREQEIPLLKGGKRGFQLLQKMADQPINSLGYYHEQPDLPPHPSSRLRTAVVSCRCDHSRRCSGVCRPRVAGCCDCVSFCSGRAGLGLRRGLGKDAGQSGRERVGHIGPDPGPAGRHAHHFSVSIPIKAFMLSAGSLSATCPTPCLRPSCTCREE